ncbi:hypothetical protein IW140_001043 [Coemansia sp. RSA 1813]|nr:hypothetical protein EV178_005178 [Coemansia sp. RSA 1646]KAJ1769777.1 hypothetical protein LPJ74_003749 [Coemansia sp. RSA 1843]KAJ2086857.1 hypothetical protein IW138_005380 [Coemansia sp. RSA 986]KAJ2215194.1 hypothetical protein EV179_002413 [Coemansia sp. RSA 487]KAJ2572294.1 hypothetical protein IW140_001043 [Coemansia sp. RSA 1813]
MNYLPVTVLEADSRNGVIVLAFGADFHVADRKGNVIATTADTVSDPTVVRVDRAGKGAAIKAVAFSRDGSLLAVCTLDKCVHIYDTATWACLRKTATEKRTNSICFDPAGDHLVTGDKFGDSYRISVHGSQVDDAAEKNKHEVLLGHVSSICDVKFSFGTSPNTQQYILTCDRDEKIRISKYPNAYNIQSFCLGHTEFVTTIATAPFGPENAVTGSGDGTVRLWDVASGQLLQTVTLEQHLSKYYADGRAVCGENTNEDRTAAMERYGVLRVRACDRMRAFIVIVERIPAVVVIPFVVGDGGSGEAQTAAGLGSPQIVDLARAPIDAAVLDARIVVSLVPAEQSAVQIAVLKPDADGSFVHDSECAEALAKNRTLETAEVPVVESVFVWGNKMYLERPRGEE